MHNHTQTLDVDLDKASDTCKTYKTYLVFSIYDTEIVEPSLFTFFVTNSLQGLSSISVQN